jgi:hypothetical protein
MLIVKVFTNKDPIGEIIIQNVGVAGEGTFTYKIIKPTGINEEIIHKKSIGYESLLLQAMAAICKSRTPTGDAILDKKSIASGEK